MFDENKEPVDIFADVDKVPPRGAAAAASQPQIVAERHGPSALLLLGIVIVLGGIGVGAYYAFFVRGKTSPAPSVATNTPAANVNAQQPVAPAPVPSPTPEPEPSPQPTPTQPVQPPEPAQPAPDADGDGLTDAEESMAGTNPQSADTDADGLTDREEVKIYGTDPKNPDTDGDTFLDGQEVKGGYNPKGSGKLFGAPGQQ